MNEQLAKVILHGKPGLSAISWHSGNRQEMMARKITVFQPAWHDEKSTAIANVLTITG